MPFDPNEISEWFWSIIERAGKDRNTLFTLLNELPEAEIRRFAQEFSLAALQLNDEPFLSYVDEDESEDGVDYITWWVVSQGKQNYVKVWENPEAMPGHVDMHNPDILFGVAEKVYKEKFGKLPELDLD